LDKNKKRSTSHNIENKNWIDRPNTRQYLKTGTGGGKYESVKSGAHDVDERDREKRAREPERELKIRSDGEIDIAR
jgi:hypothetical protein